MYLLNLSNSCHLEKRVQSQFCPQRYTDESSIDDTQTYSTAAVFNKRQIITKYIGEDDHILKAQLEMQVVR